MRKRTADLNLNDAVINYINYERKIIQDIRSFYENLGLSEAINGAAIGKTPTGKMDPHQRRVGYVRGGKGGSILLEKQIEIAQCQSFEEVFVFTEQAMRIVKGLGPLWSYDTALRIGFHLGYEPKEVYIQQGEEKGVFKLLNRKRPEGRSLSKEILGPDVSYLAPYELENFLCIWGKDSKLS